MAEETIEMKPGHGYIGDRTDQFRYSDKNGKEQWVQQVSRYKALEPIKRGQAVSVATEAQFAEYARKACTTYIPHTRDVVVDGQVVDQEVTYEEVFDEEAYKGYLNDPDSYVVLTDTKIHEKCIGLALQPAEIGQEIHFQSYGKFVFDTKYETIPETTGHSHEGKEYNPQFTYSDVGKKVYIKYPVNDAGEATGNGLLTVNDEEVLKYYHNIICLGYLTDAPQTVYNNETKNVDTIGTTTTIEISISGDQRGPLDSSQFEGVLGEDVFIPESDPIRVFAIGQEDDSKFKAMLRLTPQAEVKPFTDQDFIAFQKMDGKTAFIYFGGADNFDFNALVSDEDRAFAQLADIYQKYANDGENGCYPVTLNDKQKASSVCDNIDALETALKAAYNYVSGDTLNLTPNKPTDEYVGTIAMEAENVGGYYSLYISTSMRDRLDGTHTLSNGSFYNKGKVVLADIRVPERRSIIGIYNGYKFGKLEKDYSTIFMRMGEFRYPVDNTHINGYEVGKDYYLGVNGLLTDHPYSQVNFVNKLAVVKQEGHMIIDVGASTRYYNGDFPVGYMKPAIKGTGNEWHTDYGFMLMEGEIIHKLDDAHQALYTRLLGWFDSKDINVSGMDGYFRVPKVIRMLPGENGEQQEVYMQIKYLAEGIFEEMPRIPFKRDFQKFDAETEPDVENKDWTPVKCTIKEFEITDLIDVGINTNGVAVPDIDSLDIHLYVDPNPNYETGAHDWHEVHEGFFVYNNTTTYGFTWKITKYDADPVYAPYGKYTISTDIGDGEGIAYVMGSNQAPFKLNNCCYKLYVARRECYPRQFDLQNIFSDYLTNSVYENQENREVVCTKAVTGKAVLDAIANRFDVKRLEGTEDAVILMGSLDKPVHTLNLASSNEIPLYAPRLVLENELDDDSNSQYSFKVVVEGNELKKENGSTENIYAVDDEKHYNVDGNVIPTVEQVRKHAERTLDGSDYETNYADKTNEAGAIHGLVFGGAGNINVAKLAGIKPAKYHNTYIVDNSNNVAYIPYVFKQDSSSPYETDHEGIDVYFDVVDNGDTTVTGTPLVQTSYRKSTSSYVKEKDTPATSINVIAKDTITKGTNVKGYADRVYNQSNNSLKFETLYNFENNSIQFTTLGTNSQKIGADIYAGTYLSASLSKYKKIHGELIRDKHLVFDESLTEDGANEGRTELASTSIKYGENEVIQEAYDEVLEEGDPRGEAGTVIHHDEVRGSTNKFNTLLGSALQAAYEMPLAYWQYNTEKDWYKNTLGIVIERVEDVADNISTSDERKLFAHITDKNSDYKENTFKYSEKEIASISEYLNSVIDQSSTGQNITDSVGVLFKAAKETQERLLKLEASTFGRDYETIPGEREKYKIVGMDNVVSDPTNYGLNRLIRAICVELYQTANPFDANLSNNEYTKTSLSRIDKLDRDIHGVVNTEDNTKLSTNELNTIDSTTYPYQDIVYGDAVTAQRMSEFTPLKDVNVGTEEEPIWEKVVDTSASSLGKNVETRVYMDKADSEIVSDKSHFNGVVDAIYRITTKLNALTESINNSDNIADTPVRLNTIRQNIEHIIREAYFDEQYVIDEKSKTVTKDENDTDIVTRELERVDATEYHDVNGSEHAPYLKNYSRFDKLTENLYEYIIHIEKDGSYELGTFKEFANETTPDGKQVYYTGRTFNGKALLVDNKAEEASAHEFDAKIHIPQNLNDYEYASLIDIVVDAIGEQFYRNNAYVDPNLTDEENYKNTIRHNKTISQRLDTIETALDKVVDKLSRRKYFEDEVVSSDNKGHIYSVDKYLDFINTYLGFYQSTTTEPTGNEGNDGQWVPVWSDGIDGNGKVDGNGDDEVNSIAAEYAFRTRTNIQAGLVNTLYRLQHEEAKSDAINAILGTDFAIDTATQSIAVDPLNPETLLDTTIQKTYTTSTQYNISDDIKDLLLTIYGYDNANDTDNTAPTKYDHRTLINQGQNVNTRFVNGTTGGYVSNNIVDKIINELYFLPDPIRLAQAGDAGYDASKTFNYVTADTTRDSRYADYYNFDSNKYLYDIPDGENALSFHNRKEFFNKIGRDSDSLEVGQHSRLSRFEVIENEIRKLRDLLGLSAITSWNGNKDAINLKFGGKLVFDGTTDSSSFNGYRLSSEEIGKVTDGEALVSTDQYNVTGSTTLLEFILNNDKSNRLLRTELGFSDRSSTLSKNGFDFYYDPATNYYDLIAQPESLKSRHTVYDRLYTLEKNSTVNNQWIDSVKNIANNSGSAKVGTGNIFDLVNYLGNYTWKDDKYYYGEFGLLDRKNLARVSTNDTKRNTDVEYSRYATVTEEVNEHHQELLNIYDVIGTDANASNADSFVKVNPDEIIRTDNTVTDGGVHKKNTLWARLNAVENLNQKDVDTTNVVTASTVEKATRATVSAADQLSVTPRVLTTDDEMAENLDNDIKYTDKTTGETIEDSNVTGKFLIASKTYVDNAIIVSENNDLNRFGNKLTPEYDYTDVGVASATNAGINQTNTSTVEVADYNYSNMTGLNNLVTEVNKVSNNLQGEVNELYNKVVNLTNIVHTDYSNVESWNTTASNSYSTGSLLVWD